MRYTIKNQQGILLTPVADVKNGKHKCQSNVSMTHTKLRQLLCHTYEENYIPACHRKKPYLFVMGKGPSSLFYEKDVAVCQKKRAYLFVIGRGSNSLPEGKGIPVCDRKRV